MKSSPEHNILFLDNIRSAYNVGSLFRIADTVGISKIILCGTTPSPIDRFGRPVGEIVKVALGAEKTIPWQHVSDYLILRELQQSGYSIIALEQDTRAVDYKTLKLQKPFILVVGNEVTGVSPEILKISDTIIEIPMQGKKESLNVAVSAAVALFRIFNV